jgi:hypothetical protein
VCESYVGLRRLCVRAMWAAQAVCESYVAQAVCESYVGFAQADFMVSSMVSGR